MPAATVGAPPHDLQGRCATSPVGSPPLKILGGLTCPNPWPCAKTPAGRPSVGTGPAGLADAGTDGEDVADVAALAGAVDAVAGAGMAAVARTPGAAAPEARAPARGGAPAPPGRAPPGDGGGMAAARG